MSRAARTARRQAARAWVSPSLAAGAAATPTRTSSDDGPLVIHTRARWEHLHGKYAGVDGVSEPFRDLGWTWQPVNCPHKPACVLDVDAVRQAHA